MLVLSCCSDGVLGTWRPRSRQHGSRSPWINQARTIKNQDRTSTVRDRTW